jgi:alpha-beta hydrolase superfamily lysophospholipase
MAKFDIRVAAGAGPGVPDDAELAMTVHLPDARPPEVLVFAYPGGALGRGYFDLRFAGYAGYSQAEHLTARGIGLVAVDHLGVGDSSALPDRADQTIEMLADANAAAVAEFCRRWRDGAITDSLAGAELPRLAGLGHSMGACLLIAQQARRRCFAELALLGFSARHTAYPALTGGGVLDIRFPSRGQDPVASPPSRPFTREEKRHTYFYDDVPAALVDADLDAALGPPAGTTPSAVTVPWRSRTRPVCAAAMCSPGVVANEAAMIDVPVLVGIGERDVITDPALELAGYPRVPDFTLVRIARMSHMHNFAGTRALLWDRIARWLAGA